MGAESDPELGSNIVIAAHRRPFPRDDDRLARVLGSLTRIKSRVTRPPGAASRAAMVQML